MTRVSRLTFDSAEGEATITVSRVLYAHPPSIYDLPPDMRDALEEWSRGSQAPCLTESPDKATAPNQPTSSSNASTDTNP